MPDLLALVSKAVFEKAARDEALELGSVWPTATYASAGKGLLPLAEGGRLFLATVRPPDEALWLVAVLDRPKFDGKQWTAKANTTAIRDVSALKRSLKFATGTGLPAEAGKLGMSLQTPRVLTEDDAALLAGAEKSANAKTTDAKSVAAKSVAAKSASAKSTKAPAARSATAKAVSGAGSSAPPARARSIANVDTKARGAAAAKTARRDQAKPTGPAQIDQEAVLARWRKTRSSRLADLLCCVPVDDAWPSRLSGIARSRQHLVPPRIKSLPDDPRVTVFLVKMLQKANWPGSGAKNGWTQVFKKLVALKDKRATKPLAAMVTNPPHFQGAAFTVWCVEQITKTADALADLEQVPDDAETTRLADAQVATVPADGWFSDGKPSAGADALIAKVWAAPDDIPLRAVVGDGLLELGDPWGELIALQTAKKQDRNAIKALVRKHGKRFVGGINHVCSLRKTRFAHGFLDHCVIGRDMVGRRYWEEAAKTPHWATVRTCEIDIWGKVPKWWFKTWFDSGALASLREIQIASITLTRKSATDPWRFGKLSKRVAWHAVDTIEGLLRGLPITNLRALITPSMMKAMHELIQQAIEDAS